MRTKPLTERLSKSVWGILLASIAFYLACRNHYYTGYFGDDAAYVLAAQSLLRRSFRVLYILNTPPETHFLPGFPLSLAPFLAVVQRTNPLLRLVPLAYTAAAILLMASFAKRWLSTPLMLVGVFSFAFNPITAQYATTLMSEPFFTLLVLATFCLLASVLESNSTLEAWALALTLGWAMLTRPIGVILWPAVAIALLLSRRWKAMAISLGASIIPWILFALRNVRVSGSANDYLKFWQGEFSSLSGIWMLVSHTAALAREICVIAILNLGVWMQSEGTLATILALLVIALCIGGAFSAYQRMPAQRPLLIASLVYVTLYIVVHGLWLTFQNRYAMPLLPFLLIFFLRGLDLCITRRGVAILAIGILVPGLLAENYYLLRETYSTTRLPELHAPLETMQWIQDHVPADELVCTRSPARLFFYTDRPGVGWPNPRDREEARYLMLNNRMTTVIVEKGGLLSLPGDSSANQAAIEYRLDTWVSQWPEEFHSVYHNEEEGTAVYQLQPDQAYVEAYAFYAAARASFQKNLPEIAFSELDRALQRYPAFASALGLYGAALVIKGTDPDRAERLLRQSLTVMPGYPLAELNLARLAMVRHQWADAQTWLDQTRRSIQDPASGFRNLEPTIDTLEKSIPNGH